MDASIIATAASTKNRDEARDPETNQTRRGHQWHFGAKTHIGVDANSGLVHRVECTAANLANGTQTAHLLHGEEQDVNADVGYFAVAKREEFRDQEVCWLIAEKRHQVAGMDDRPLSDLTRQIEHLKARIRARVEPHFHIVKDSFRHCNLAHDGIGGVHPGSDRVPLCRTCTRGCIEPRVSSGMPGPRNGKQKSEGTS